MWMTVSANKRIGLIEGINVKRRDKAINKKGEFLHNWRTGLRRPAGFQHQPDVFDGLA